MGIKELVAEQQHEEIKKVEQPKKKRRYVAARIGRIGNWTRIERAWKRGWKIEKGLDRVGGKGDWKCWLGRIYAWETKKKARNYYRNRG